MASGVAGKDYDYRIRYADGREVCADAKCRLEGTEMRAETIMNALKKARSKAGRNFRESASQLARSLKKMIFPECRNPVPLAGFAWAV